MAEYGQGRNWVNHEVHTDDGYILNMFRILPQGAHSATQVENFGEPVFLMHGMTENASHWIKNPYNEEAGEELYLALALAEAGYDVWLGNQRGTRFSSEHETLDQTTDEETYWAFSFAEMGDYDLPAMLSSVVEETGGRKVSYIGYSLGTTQMFYALQSATSQ